MSDAPNLSWSSLLWETRGYLGLDEEEPIPLNELVEQAKSNGWREQEVRDALRDTDALEAVGEVEDMAVQEAEPAERGISGEMEPETGDANPGGSDEIPDDDVRSAFADALRFFHHQLDTEIRDHTDTGGHPDRPTTAREYFTDRRGWSDAVLEEALLGWAPPNNGLLDALVARGYGRDTILATGLFNKNLEPLWQGRYVLAYFDEDGRPAYAIARCTGDAGGGAAGYDGHPDDHMAGKYAKVRHSDDRVPISEPIYGLDTLEDGEPVLIAEGIADAITARERGWSVLSPVTKEFKRDHFPPLLDALERYDVPRVVVVADNDSWDPGRVEEAKPPHDRITEAVTLPATAPGIGGALRTADYLEREGVDARVAVPPAPLGDDNDLDEYLQKWAATPAALVRSARPPQAFPEYDHATRSASSTSDPFDTEDEYGRDNDPRDAEAPDTERSRLWDLDLGDLCNAEAGDRGKNPLGHTGSSENYFVVRKGKSGDLVGRDYKRGVVYNALTYLLVDAGERTVSAPEGDLDDQEVWHAWKQAHARNHLPVGDTVPYRALVGVALEDGLLSTDDLNRWDDGGGRKLPRGAYDDVLEHIREEYGIDPGREATPTGDNEDNDAADPRDANERDPRELLDPDGVVVEPRNALAAAAAVEPDDLRADVDLPELEREGVEDVAIAVALAEGTIRSPEEFPGDGRYTDAYYRARDHYGAPLPKYLDNTTLEYRTDLIFAALGRVRPEHILENLRSEVTVEDPPGEAVARINPTWEESESGERIIAGYGRGFWCAEHSPDRPEGGRTFDPLQVVALEHGLVEDEFIRPSGEAFKQAYTLLREEYRAPLPKWRATLLEHVAVLPPAARLLGEEISAESGATLAEARERTERLVRDAAGVNDRAQLLTSLPGTGKTYSTGALADDHPTLYLAQRNDLKQQIVEYVDEICADDEHHPDAEPSVAHLPIFAEDQLPDEALRAGVEAVRDHGRELLRDTDALLEHVVEYLGTGDTEEEDAADLERGTCETADGEYGDGWRVRLQIARALGSKPAEIHQRSRALFGEEIPCQHDGPCSMTEAWDQIRDPENPIDLLVGSPGHAFVDSATTHFATGPDGDRVETPRVVAMDEFPEESYFSGYGERFMDHAVWLAEALVGIDTREDLVAADLQTDTWVDLWLDGEGDEYGLADDAIAALGAAESVAEASRRADEILERDRFDPVAEHTAARLPALRRALETLANAAPGDDLAEILDTVGDELRILKDDADTAYAEGAREPAGELYAFADELDSLLEDLAHGLDLSGGEGDLLATVRDRVDELPVDGDLRGLLETAVDAVRGDAPTSALEAAVDALRGGRAGCRELAIFANDGYAHPDAWALLAGAIADTENASVREVELDAFAFDGEREGGRFKRLRKNGATIAADKNHHGALVVDTPAFTDITGTKCPLLGLDATGRPELWRLAIGRDVEVRDIHTTDAARRRFLRDVGGLRVIQTSSRPLPYHGNPDGKNFNADLELVETVADRYTGPGGIDDKGPAVLSTKKVLTHLEEDLAPHAGATVNYENMKGSDALGDHQVAAILGSQHYGDRAPEKWALVAGEDAGRGDTRGADLDYGSGVANAYLRYMREDHVMQAALRVGRNEQDTLVFAHTSALRADLPVVAEGGVISAHSKGTLAVAEAAAELTDGAFTARDVLDAIDDDERAVGLRQVQNVLADLRESGHLRVEHEGGPGVSYEYDLEEDPGLADVDLPDLDAEGTNETSRIETQYTWYFVSRDGPASPPATARAGRPVIPAGDTLEAAAEGDPPT